MRNFLAVYSKEMRSYFVSPVAYVIAGVFLFLSGYLFRNILMQFNMLCLQLVHGAGRCQRSISTKWSSCSSLP